MLKSVRVVAIALNLLCGKLRLYTAWAVGAVVPLIVYAVLVACLIIPQDVQLPNIDLLLTKMFEKHAATENYFYLL